MVIVKFIIETIGEWTRSTLVEIVGTWVKAVLRERMKRRNRKDP